MYQYDNQKRKGRKKSKYLLQSLFFFCAFWIFFRMSACNIYGRNYKESGTYKTTDETIDRLTEKMADKTFQQTEDTGNQQPSIKLYAASALLLDGINGRVLYEKDGYKVMPMASTTKILTAILALENGNMEDVVTVSKYAASMPKVRLGIKAGEKYYLRDLMYSLMLESHNDAAVAIAEHIGGSVEGFGEMMNQKARDLGCGNSFFITPNGLDASAGEREHSTTAYELAKIAAYAIKNQEFRKLIATKSAGFCEINSGKRFLVYNKNRFLDMMNGAVGIKTGFTNKAGYCFVGAVDRDDKTLISVVLACGWPPNKNYKWADTKELMKYGMDNYQKKSITPVRIPKQIPVEKGVEKNVEIYAEPKEVPLLLAKWDKVEVKYQMKDCLEAPVEKNEVVGYEFYYLNNQVYNVFPIKTKYEVKEYDYPYCLTIVVKMFLQ